MDKQKLVKIITPICIILVVVGIWVFKNVDIGLGPADRKGDAGNPCGYGSERVTHLLGYLGF